MRPLRPAAGMHAVVVRRWSDPPQGGNAVSSMSCSRTGRRKLGLLLVPLGVLAAVLSSAAPAMSATPDVDGDGAIAADCRPLDPSVFPGAPDAPDLALEDTNCDGIDGDLATAVFVSVAGSDQGTGSKESPLRTITAGIARAEAQDKDVYVTGGTYTEMVALRDDVRIFGGHKPVTGERSRTEITTIAAAPQAMLADGDTGVVLQLLTLQGSPDGARTAYGLRAVNGSRVALIGVDARAANAISGAAGGNGANGAAGTNGGPGGAGGCDASGGGGAGGVGARDGGAGGFGGIAGFAPRAGAACGPAGNGGAGGPAPGGAGSGGEDGATAAETGRNGAFTLANAAAAWVGGQAAQGGSSGVP